MGGKGGRVVPVEDGSSGYGGGGSKPSMLPTTTAAPAASSAFAGEVVQVQVIPIREPFGFSAPHVPSSVPLGQGEKPVRGQFQRVRVGRSF